MKTVIMHTAMEDDTQQHGDVYTDLGIDLAT
jgi:hypothetical protein